MSSAAKRILVFLAALGLLLPLLAGCGQTQDNPTTAAPAQTTTEAPSQTAPQAQAIAPFNVPSWLEFEENKMAFQYIDVPVYSDTWSRGEEAAAHLEANATEKADILAFLEKVFFAPIETPPATLTTDFAFAMNEPFVFFCFTEDGLLVKLPGPDSTDYLYFEASFEDYPELWELREYIGEMRLGHAAGERE